MTEMDTELSRTPLLRDPYEERVLAVRESSVPGAGRGGFTRRPVREVTVRTSN